MQEAIKDVLSGGGSLLNKKLYSVGYYKEEFDLRTRLGVMENYKPEHISDLEKKMIDYLKAEKVLVGMSGQFPCEVAVFGYEGCIAVVVPTEALHDEDRTERICALAHELGHYLNFKFDYDFDILKFESYKHEEKKKEKEVIAWKYAYVILKALGFTDWERFLAEMKRALMTYFNFWEEVIVDNHVREISEKLIKTA